MLNINEEKPLELKFDPRTIEHLGIKMYSQLPYALAELVANAYDACADIVEIKLYDEPSDAKKIVVIDDGDGMSYEEVRDAFLVIGRKRRNDDDGRVNAKGRKITGKKGLGKLALFGMGKIIQIQTTKANETHETLFTLNWDEILSEATGSYKPVTERIEKTDITKKGTTITLLNLSRVSTFDAIATASSLSKLFNCFGSDFSTTISLNGNEPINLTREMRYSNIDKQFEWDVVNLVNSVTSEYRYKTELKGKIISSKKPIRPDLRGITLYVNGRLANIPSFFNVPEAGHTFSYVSGWVDADFLDEFDKDLISTDRQSLSWDEPEAKELQELLQKIIRFIVSDWSRKRKKSKDQINSERTGINIEEWLDKVPREVSPRLRSVIDNISEKPELDDEDFSAVVREVHDLIPPYTYLHYRHLHEQVQNSAGPHYKANDFYVAFQEAMKRYKNAVKRKSGLAVTEDLDIVLKAFGKDEDKPLSVTAKFSLRPDGQPFSPVTLSNIEEAQRFLSQGAVQGGRNVVSHEEHTDLRETGLFTEKDCLDLLSLLSHLFKRLDESESRTTTEGDSESTRNKRVLVER